MHIRQMVPDDIDFAHHLIKLEEWGTLRAELEDFLEYDLHGSFIAEIGKKPVGMVTTIHYGVRFGFIGNLVVLKEHRKRKIGTQLMQEAIRYIKTFGIDTIALDGVLEAIPIYERLGFKKNFRSLRMIGDGKFKVTVSTASVRSVVKEDLPKIFEMDKTQFKEDRSLLIRRLFSRFPSLCLVSERNDKITSYIIGTEKFNWLKIGPWVVTTEEPTPEILLAALVKIKPETKVIIGVLEENIRAINTIKTLGFSEKKDSPWRMTLGKEITFSNGLFAIAGPDRG